MDTPPPIPAPPVAPQQQVVIPPPKSGCGCFAGGCLSVLVIITIALVVLFGCAWFIGVKVLSKFTATEPIEISMTQPSAAEYSAADAKMNQLKNALRTNEATTVSFSAADLNALVARSPELASQKGRMRFEIADSKMTVAMSVSFRKSQIPGIKTRWFNGSARFSVSYEDDTFNFNPDWIEANGHQFTGDTIRSIASSLGRSYFVTDFEDDFNKNGKEYDWTKVKSMKLQGDQLVITTFGPPGT